MTEQKDALRALANLLEIEECLSDRQTDFAKEPIAQIRLTLLENSALKARVEKLREELRDISENWDCDSDAHKYGTPCRCCQAKAALEADGGGK